jgi:hypothetical protein
MGNHSNKNRIAGLLVPRCARGEAPAATSYRGKRGETLHEIIVPNWEG